MLRHIPTCDGIPKRVILILYLYIYTLINTVIYIYYNNILH